MQIPPTNVGTFYMYKLKEYQYQIWLLIVCGESRVILGEDFAKILVFWLYQQILKPRKSVVIAPITHHQVCIIYSYVGT